MLVLCYPNCSTCQKALKHLDKLNLSYELRDIKLNNPSLDEIKHWHRTSNLDIKKFFNTSGIKYRELNLKDKLKTMSIEEMYELLASDGMLVKRPIIITNDKVIIGYKEDIYNTL